MPSSHPNATAGALAGALAIIVVWLLGLFGVDPPAEVGGAIATVFTVVALLLGRCGPAGPDRG